MREQFGYRPRNMGFTSPVKVGEELDVKIEAVGEKGDGIAKKSGFVLFVPNTKTGDEVKIRVTRVLRKVGFAEVIGEGSVKKSAKTEESESEDAEEAPEDTENFGEELEESKEEPEENTEKGSEEEY